MNSMNSPRIARAACLASLGLALLVPGVAHADDMYAETSTNVETSGGMEALVDQGVTHDSDNVVATDSDAANTTDMSPAMCRLPRAIQLKRLRRMRHRTI